jgi:DNA end-binding protein Ku
MKSIWSGVISLGLINAPVHIVSAVKNRKINFGFLRKSDMSRVGYVRVSKSTGEQVPYEDLVRGFEYKKGDFVVIDKEDFKRAKTGKHNSIELMDFVPENEINTKYYEKPYYLEPQKGGEKIYILLREALIRSKKAGIVRFILKQQEHLGVVKAENTVMVLNEIRYETQIINPSNLYIPKNEKISQTELNMALQLINKLTHPFKPERYPDTYTEELKQTITNKTVEQESPLKETENPQITQEKDIISKLKESLKNEQNKRAFA